MFFEFDVFLGVNTDLILNNFLRIDVVLCSIRFKEKLFLPFSWNTPSCINHTDRSGHELTLKVSLIPFKLIISISIRYTHSILIPTHGQDFFLHLPKIIPFTAQDCHYSSPLWPDWAINCTLGNFFEPVATIFLSKMSTFFRNVCKGVEKFNFSREIFLGNFYRHLATFYWSHCSSPSTQDWLNCLMAFHWGNWENNLYEIVHEKVTSLSHSRSRLPNPIACGRLGNLKNEHIKVKQTELELMTSPILKSH